MDIGSNNFFHSFSSMRFKCVFFLFFVLTIVLMAYFDFVLFLNQPRKTFFALLNKFSNETNEHEDHVNRIENFTSSAPELDHLENCVYKLPNKTTYTNVIRKEVFSFDQIKENLTKNGIKLMNGGKSFTHLNSNCSIGQNVAFIIPYRDRLNNLKVFLNNMHPFLTRQKINYGIYLIEPVKTIKFNRALLMNIGFVEAQKDTLQLGIRLSNSTNDETQASSDYKIKPSPWNCFVFHDVDMIPESEKVLYTCDKTFPMHYAVAVSKFGYDTTGYFSHYFGGVNSFTKDQFLAINGFSNMYFGWGGEDDDLYARAMHKFKKIKKLEPDVGRYWTHEHAQDPNLNPDRFSLLKNAVKNINHGLSDTNYTVKSVQKEYLFTRVLVEFDDEKMSR